MFKPKKLMAFLMSTVMTVTSSLSLTSILASAEENGSQTTADEGNSEYSVQGTGSIGSMLSDEINESLNSDLKNEAQDYSINRFDFDGETAHATIEYSALEDCIIFLGIYNNEGTELITSATKKIKSETNGSTDIYISDALPEFYIPKVFMVGMDNRPLSLPSSSNEYTKEMHDILEKTIDDFDGQTVINLDSSSTNNFIVPKKGTVTIMPTETENIYKGQNDKSGYVFENLDKELLDSIAKDSIIYVPCDNAVLLKVDKIEKSGTDVVIYEQDCLLPDLCDFIKIDTSQGDAVSPFAPQTADTIKSYSNEETEYDISSINDLTASSPNIQTLDDEPDDFHLGSYSFALDLVTWKLENSKSPSNLDVNYGGRLTVSGDVSFRYYCEFSYCSFDIIINNTLGVEGFIKSTKDSNLPNPFKNKTPHAVPGFYVPLGATGIEWFMTPQITFFALGNFNVSLNSILDIKYDTRNGWSQNITSDFSPDVSINANVEVGLKLTSGICLLNKSFINASIAPEFGLGASGTIYIYSKDAEHACQKCLDGNFYGYFRLNLGGYVFEDTWLEQSLTYMITIMLFEQPFYCSSDIGFGLGECPNNKNPQPPQKITIPEEYDSSASHSYSTDFETNMFHYTFDGETLEVGRTQEYIINDENKSFDIFLDKSNVEEYISWDSIKRIVINDEKICFWDSNYFSLIPNLEEVQLGYFSTADLESANDNRIMAVLFSNCNALKNVIMPDRITEIGAMAFKNCISLKEIDLPDCLKSIEKEAFNNCGLEIVDCPESLEKIESQVFANNQSLKEINLNEGLKYIGFHVFENDNNLKAIVLPTSLERVHNEAFNGSCIEAVTINSDFEVETPTVLASIFGGTNLKRANFSNSTTQIHASEFANAKYLKTVKFSENLKTIGERAFYCSGIEKVILPESLEVIGENAFCRTLMKEATIPKNVKLIQKGAFKNDNSLYKKPIFTKITILNKDCELEIGFVDSTTTICGYWNSTAHDYAIKYGNPFIPLDPENVPVTTLTDKAGNIVTTTTVTTAAVPETESTATTIVTSFVYEKAKPNNEYILLAVKDTDGNPSEEIAVEETDILSVLDTSNLSYFDQQTADENGVVKFVFNLTDENKNDTFVFIGDLGKGAVCRTEGTLEEIAVQEPMVIKEYPVTTTAPLTTVTTTTTTSSSTQTTSTQTGTSININTETTSITNTSTTMTTTITALSSTQTTSTEADTSTSITSTSAVTTTTQAEIVTTVTTSSVTPTETKYEYGDVTGDGSIDARDASAVLTEYANTSAGYASTLSQAQIDAADINKDGKLDARDASLLLTFYAQASTDNGEQSLDKFIESLK